MVFHWSQDKNLASLCGNLDKFELFSFDIFDTILFRSVAEPAEIFRIAGEVCLHEGYLDQRIDADEYKNLRILAEEKARKEIDNNERFEITLDDIYDCLPMNLGDKEKMKEVELETEVRYSYLNIIIVDLIKQLKTFNKKVVLLSDMYLSCQEITKILEARGFPMDAVDHFWVSSEINKSKHHGNIYENLVNLYPDISPDKICHIGDNFVTDYINARKNGITAIHYDINSFPGDSSMNTEKTVYGVLCPEIYQLRKLAGNLDKYQDTEEQFWYSFGATILGPFLTLFIEWILDTCKKMNITNIYPLMSEGKLFYELLVESLKYKTENYNLKLVYTSRRSTFLAALEKYDLDTLKPYLRSKLSLKAFFELFEIKDIAEEFHPFLDVEVKDSDRYQLDDGKTLKMKLVEFMLSEETRESVHKAVEWKAEMIKDYFVENFDLNGCALVDLGYKGTVSRNISFILDKYAVKYHFVTLLAICERNYLANILESIDIRGFTSGGGKYNNLVYNIREFCGILESLCTKESRSTIDYYVDSEGEVKPVLDTYYHECKTETQNKRILLEGVKTFQRLFLETFDAQSFQFNTIRKDDYLKMIERFLQTPAFSEAENLGRLTHEDKIDGFKPFSFIDKQSLDILEQSEIDSFEDKTLKEGVCWSKGVITLKYPYYYIMKKIKETLPYEINGGKIYKLLDYIIKAGIGKLIVYGGGEAGRTINKYLKILNIEVDFIVDKNPALWGTYINHTQIVEIDHALTNSSTNNILIASFSFVEEIKQFLLEKGHEYKRDFNLIYYNSRR